MVISCLQYCNNWSSQNMLFNFNTLGIDRSIMHVIYGTEQWPFCQEWTSSGKQNIFVVRGEENTTRWWACTANVLVQTEWGNGFSNLWNTECKATVIPGTAEPVLRRRKPPSADGRGPGYSWTVLFWARTILGPRNIHVQEFQLFFFN